MPALAIVISGAPGSGKSTLAGLLSKQMLLPRLNKDLVMCGLRRSGLERSAANDTAFNIVFETASEWLRSGVSFLLDLTLHAGFSEPALRKLLTEGRTVNVHCRASNALERFERRQAASPGMTAQALSECSHTWRAIQGRVTDPLDLRWTVIEVDATNGYSPSLEVVIGRLDDAMTTQETEA